MKDVVFVRSIHRFDERLEFVDPVHIYVLVR